MTTSRRSSTTRARPGLPARRLTFGWRGRPVAGSGVDPHDRGGTVWSSVATRPSCVPRDRAGMTARPTMVLCRRTVTRQKSNRLHPAGRSLMPVSTDTTPSAEAGHDDRRTRLARCLQRAPSGELAALDEGVRELNPPLLNVARAQSLTVEETADVVQTTWLELLRRLQEIRAPQALAAWVVTPTRREAGRGCEPGRPQNRRGQ